MDLKEFDYHLPPDLIAQEPSQQRDESRLLTVNRKTGEFGDRIFKEIVQKLSSNDVLIMNNTQVFPARLHGTKVPGGAAIEMLLLEKRDKFDWVVIAYRASRLKVGSVVVFSPDLTCEVIECLPEGKFHVRFTCEGDWNEVLSKIGEIPLPPYIERDRNIKADLDKERYQTVYAQYHDQYNSAAAPTAGFHFTPEIIDQLTNKGVQIEYVTLRVGLDTFLPMRVDRIQDHKMHSEAFYVPDQTAFAVSDAKKNGKRIIAVGTTSVRVLESAFDDDTATLLPGHHSTNLYIYPGYEFKCVDAMITNFHLPRSTLLLLISSFMGQDLRKQAYQHAIEYKYRFYSYGDAMFIE